jgi:hypothetical protein
MAMGYQPKGFAVVPLSLGMSLAAEADGVKRCRSCEAFSGATHGECAIHHKRKAAYAGVCKQRVPLGQALPTEGQRLCKGCGADISLRQRTATYCGNCRIRFRADGPAFVGRKRTEPRLCATCGADISHRRSHALYCEPCRAKRDHRANDATPHRKGCAA